ncbi:MAG: hypothetical protein ABF297_08565 [Thiogranum sp.]
MEQTIKLNYCGNLVDALYDGDDTKAIEAAEAFVQQMHERVSKAYPGAEVSVSTDWTVPGTCDGCKIEGFAGDAPLEHIAAIEVALLCEITWP